MKPYLMIIAGVLISIIAASMVVYISHMVIIQNIKKPNIVVSSNNTYHPILYDLAISTSASNYITNLSKIYEKSSILYVKTQKDTIFHIYPNFVIITPSNNSFVINLYYSVNDRVNIAVNFQIYNISITNSTIIDDNTVITNVTFTFYNSTPNSVYLIPIWNQYNETQYLIVFYL
ncbi:MAG: hypothetical protein QXY68_02375 [Saccharolobus sp.]